MADFPAFCTYCGLIFPVRLPFGSDFQLFTRGSRATCPNCGRMAALPDGTFNIENDTIEVLSASPLTRERLLRLQALLEKQLPTDEPTEKVEAAVLEEAPALAPLLAKYGPKMRRALLMFLLFVIQTLVQEGLAEVRDHSATKADVERAVQQVVQRCRVGAPRPSSGRLPSDRP